MKAKSIIAWIGYLTAVFSSIILLFFVIALTWIGFEVKNTCQLAKRTYAGDCVESLAKLLQDDHQGFRLRNDAIWALGQLGDIKALPVLESYYTGIIPDREPLDLVISQYELKKAINLANGGTNIGAWAWRWGIN